MARFMSSHLRRKLALAGVTMLVILLLGSSIPRAKDASASTGASLASLRVINYFPSSDGWGSMWWNWNPAHMETDFARIASLHANAVRIIVSAPAFGFPKISPTMISRLSQTIDLAAAQGLHVELTLFNEWHDYTAIQESKAWASELLDSFRGDPQIAYIDLHNELPANTNGSALSWAQAMVPYVQSVDGGIPVTVSTSISSGVAPLKALVKGLASSPPNLYDVHYYGSAADAYGVLRDAKHVAGSIPMFVGETGFATDPSYGWARELQPSAPSLESYQDYYFRMIEYATQALELPPAAPWILYDMPGQGGTQWGYHMGILHSDGTPKPAAITLAGLFSGGSVGLSFNNGFEERNGDPPEPSVWRRWLAPDAKFSIDGKVAHSGSASARIDDAGGNHLIGCPAFYAAPIAAIVPNVTYTAGAWVRGQATRGESRVVLVWSNLEGHYIASSDSTSLPSGTFNWRELTVSAKPPPGAAAVEIDLQVCENPGTTWFDDVTFSPSG